MDELAAPESYRARATSSIGYISAAAGVVAGGLTFGAQAELPAIVRVAGVCAVSLFVVSIAFLARAALHTRVDYVDDMEAEAREMVITIRRRTQLGILFAALAALAVLVMIVGVALPKEESRVNILLTSLGHSDLAIACPAIRRSFVASVEKASLAANSPTITLKLPRKSCAANENSSSEVTLLRTQVALIVKSSN